MNSVLKFLIKLNSDATSLVTEARRVTAQLDAVRAKANSTGASLKKAFSASTFASSLRSMPGMEFLMNPYVLLGAGIGAIAKIGSEAEMTASAFTTLVGSEEKAKGVLAEIKAFADSTPFSRLQLTENTQKMMNYGVASDKALGYLKQLGDISGGDAEKLSSLSLVMGQVAGAGKLMGQELIQFVNAGFNPLQELSVMTGKSYGELRDLMEKGAVSTEHVAVAIQHATSEGGKFHNLLNNMSNTVGVRFMQLVGSIQTMAVELFEVIKPSILDILDVATVVIPIVGSALKFLFTGIAGVISFFREWKLEITAISFVLGVLLLTVNAHSIAVSALALHTMLASKATAIWSGVQMAFNAVMSLNPIGAVIVLIAALVAGIVYCWQKFAGFRAFIITMWDTIKTFGNIIKEFLIDRFTSLIKGIGQIGKALLKLFEGDFSGAWTEAQEGLVNISGVNAGVKAFNSAKEAVSSTKDAFQNNLAIEQAKDNKKGSNAVSTPSLKGSASPVAVPDFTPQSGAGGKGKKGKGSKDADAVATGGSRPTTINVSIGKFFDDFKVTMMDKADTHEIERVVLQALNRSLSIATNVE